MYFLTKGWYLRNVLASFGKLLFFKVTHNKENGIIHSAYLLPIVICLYYERCNGLSAVTVVFL